MRRIGYLWNRRRLEREMVEEMAYHREQMAPDRRRDFGSDLRLREDAREIWGWTWLDRLRQDLTYGARVLRQSPGFTLTTMLVLALGIGVPLTAFRVVLADLRGGSAPDPDTLVHLTRRAPDLHITNLPYPELVFYAGKAQCFRQVIGVSDGNPAVFGEIADGRAAEHIQLGFATANYFPEFGIIPAAGRFWSAEDERPGAEPVAVVSELFWRQRLGGSAAKLGQDIRVNGKPVRVVGVIPRSAPTRAEVWMPLAQHPYAVEGSTLLTGWNSALDVYGRLKPGVPPKAAEQETLALAAALRAIRPDQVRPGEYLEVSPIRKLDPNSSEFQIALTAGALVMLLLAAACANIGTLVLARGVKREREIQIRMALGAGRRRVVRQLFTESLLLAVLSGFCGLLLSTIALKTMQLRSNPDSGILADWRVLGATLGIAFLATLVFGLPPALRLTSLTPRGGRARTIFLAAQMAASCLLLVVSSLMAGVVERLGRSDPGFDYRHLVWVSPGLKAHGYSGPAARAYLDQLRARALGLPDVKAASQVWLAPWGDFHMGALAAGREFAGNRVDEQFLNTMGIRMVRGRDFRPGEHGAAIISETTERVLWPNGDALGKALPWDAGSTVIGIVRNASTNTVGIPNPMEFYLPPSSADAPESILLLRVAGSPRDSVRGVQEAARTLDARLQPTVHVVTDSYDREVEKVSRAMMAMSMMGGAAILLSAIGLGGLAGYTVAQRTREIGLRMALGARPAQVAGSIVSPMWRPIATGFVCGAAGGAAVARILRSGTPTMAAIEVFDPLAYLTVLAFLAAVVSLSILAPARRAIRINPGKALQHE